VNVPPIRQLQLIGIGCHTAVMSRPNGPEYLKRSNKTRQILCTST
jgi:hypothetical protein